MTPDIIPIENQTAKPLLTPTIKRAASMVVFFMIFCFLYIGVTNVFKDKRLTFPWNVTAKVNGFYNETKNSLDFIFIGSSQMFTSVSPAVLWSEYGITSYDFGANEQPLWISYYFIKEAVKTQKPEAVALDVRYCFFGNEYATEGVTHINLDDLRWSADKVHAILDSVAEGQRYAYFLELMKYHPNWNKLGEAYFTRTRDLRDPYKGYTPQLHVKDYPELNPSFVESTEIKDLTPRNEQALLDIIKLSKDEGFTLLLMKIPDSILDSQPRYNRVAQIAAENGIDYIDYNKIMSGENHMNIINAEKFTKHLGGYLTEHYDVTDKRGDPAFAQWDDDSQYFYQQKQKYLIANEKDFSKYLEYAANPHYLLLIAARDEASNRMADFKEQWRKLGFTVSLEGHYRESFIGVINNGVVVHEDVQAQALSYDDTLDGLHIQIASQGFEYGNKASIRIDGKELALNKRGLNIAVYDTFLREVVDKVTFDTFDQLQCSR